MVDGVLNYVDGVVCTLEVDSVTIFEDVLMSMLEKRIKHIGKMWYKLPFEDLSDRKPLWENVDANKKKLVAKGRWMGEVDIYFEKEVGECVEGVDTRAVGNKDTAIGGEKITEETQLLVKDVACDDNDEGQNSEACLSESSESDVEADIVDEEAEVVEEDIQIFNNQNYEEQISDEDDVYPATDDESGDEEAQTERMQRGGLLDGVFSLKQVFNSGSEFKKNVIKYVLKTRRNVVYDRWEKEKLGAKCKAKGCGWKIYCAVENPIGKWMVKTYDYDHQCHPTGRCEIVKTPVIADLFLEDIRRDPEMSGLEIKDEMKRRYNIIISPNQAKVARRRVFDKLQAECDEQFARLRDYELHLIT
ncbi:PREDICTED: uncharacterized protein LOC104732376 [Camelina sativa]|uniref:Uncharacterized protein LOC104732376 n=1 Tax=Camelina sativa TaxID=90675 RepID=A0ABM0V3H6_CAMSA|nr:PREDICTED: uncharacterized protein LOC104732376 [Camelina sativa]